MHEIWVQIVNYPLYEVSNYGRIRKISTGRILVGSNSGYTKTCTLSHNGRVKNVVLKQLVAEYFLEPPMHYDMIPLQLDGDYLNCEAGNLMWAHKSDIYWLGSMKREGQTNILDLNVEIIEIEEVYANCFAAAARLDGFARVVDASCRNQGHIYKGFTFRWV